MVIEREFRWASFPGKILSGCGWPPTADALAQRSGEGIAQECPRSLVKPKSPIQKSGNENNGLKYDRDTPIFAKNAENRALTALSSSPLQAERIITY